MRTETKECGCCDDGGCPLCEVIETCCCCWRCGPTRHSDPSDVDGFNGPTSLTVTVNAGCIGEATVTCDLTFCGCDPLVDPDECEAGTSEEGLDTITWYGETEETVSGSCIDCDDDSLVTWPSVPVLVVTIKCYHPAGEGGTTRRFVITFTMYGTTGMVYAINLPLINVVCDPFSADSGEDAACWQHGLEPEGFIYTRCTTCDGSPVTVEVTA